MEGFLLDKKQVKGRISRILRSLEKELPTKPADADAKIKQLDEALTRLDGIIGDIIKTCAAKDQDGYLAEIDETYDKVEEARGKLRDVASAPPTPTPTSSTSPNDSRLPEIRLPTFNGDRAQFSSFWSLFEASVHRRSISAAMKMEFLLSCLKGRAAQVVSHLQISDSNYDTARELLQKKYENKRKLVFDLLQKLVDQPKAKDKSYLEDLLDTTKAIYHALDNQGHPVETGDALFVFLIHRKLDDETSTDFKTFIGDKIPTAKEFLAYLQDKADAWDDLGISRPIKGQRNNEHKPRTPEENKRLYCPACREYHAAVSCTKFTKLTNEERWKLIKTSKVCFNCLRPDHASPVCKSTHCKKCTKRHHTLLHKEGEFNGHCTNIGNTLLPTATIKVLTARGQTRNLRALLDSGSTVDLITTAAVNQLQLPRKPTMVNLRNVGGNQTIKHAVNLQINGKGNQKIATTALVVDSLPNLLPAAPVQVNTVGLNLADKNFNKPSPVDVILSSRIFFSSLEDGTTIRRNDMIALKTCFGHVVASTSAPKGRDQQAYHADIAQDFSALWSLERGPVTPPSSEEAVICETLFKTTTKRLENGAYQVSLPIVKETDHLHITKALATKRFTNLELKLQKNPTYEKTYKDQIKEYMELGHMTPAPTKTKGPTCYLPHHAVFKDTSTTTKLRIVFDASAAPKGSASLNQTMLTGPRIQEELFSILCRFRLHPVALTADIEGMYRQIHLDPEQRNLHRVLWRSDPTQRIEEYNMTRLTFGTRAAPYLATRVLKQLAEDEIANFPNAARILKEDFYVDDLMTGSTSPTAATDLKRELTELLQAGGFRLRKWASNTSHESSEAVQLKNEEYVSTLGIHWHPKPDEFRFSINQKRWTKITKRTVLSAAAKLFDPLGWLLPVTIFSRIFIQKLWKENISWDEPLKEDTANEWNRYTDNLQHLEEIKVNRHLKMKQNSTPVLCGFSDSSEKAYTAAVYLRSEHKDGTFTSELVAARSRVAPVRPTTLPRLELAAAVLLVRLVQEVKQALRMDDTPTHYWTDSEIVLSWLRSPSYRWETFIANRVAEIHSCSSHTQWHKVNTKENPADCGTRPMVADDLKNSDLWWHGPPWLRTAEWILNETLEEPAVEVTLIATTEKKDSHRWTAFSSFDKMCRVLAYVQRFISNCRRTKTYGPIQPTEFQGALAIIIKSEQAIEFKEEHHCLTNNKPLPTQSRLKQLTPFLDHAGMLRVTGRLQQADIPYDQRHPIIIPNNKLAELLIESEHKRNLHAGASLLQAILRNQFWILGGKRSIKKVIHKCLTCHRQKAALAQQMMGNLPRPRVTPSRPFTETGVDYCGPVTIRPLQPRSKTRLKAYIAVFVCMATKAIHLEAVSSMTTDAFIATLRRFIARRGHCNNIYSDNGTNFVGADNTFKEFLDVSQPEIQNLLTPVGISWHFQPPIAPHFGGIYEAGVKSTKFHLRRAMGNATYTYEELQTLLCQIEACLNSRPLCPLTEDPNDLAALTPGHFLIGSALTAPPDVDLRDLNPGRLDRWQLLQQVTQKFWDRWSQEYLHQLQQRPKWTRPSKNIEVGDLVLLQDQHQPPTKWSLGRIQEVFPGQDNHVRVVKVKTTNGEVKRPISALTPLPKAV